MSSPQGSFILTGASRGIGLAIAQEYTKAAYPYTGIFTVRDTSAPAAQSLQTLIVRQPPQTVETLELSALASVRLFASGILSRVNAGTLPPIRALLLNAGLQDTTGLKFNEDGYETTFVVNYLANFLIILLLLPAMDKQRGRIVFVSSSAHDPDHWLNQGFSPDLEAWRDPEELARRPVIEERGDEDKAGLRRYGASKLWTVMLTYELQRRLDLSSVYNKVSITSVNPAAVGGTDLTRTHGWLIRVFAAYVMVAFAMIMRFFLSNPPFRTAQHSARDLLDACFQEDGAPFGDLEGRKGKYFDGKVELDSSVESRDETKQRKLWEGSLDLVWLKEEDLPF